MRLIQLLISCGAFSATSGGSRTLAVGGTPPPTITGVQDAGSYTANVAQGSIFVVTGTGPSNAGFFQEGYPLPTTSAASNAGGVSITFTPLAGGNGTKAYLIYEYNQSGVNQLAAVLPSTLTAGPYNVTVTTNGLTSAPFQTTVAQSKPEVFTVDSTGHGLALVQNYISSTQLDLNRYTTGTVGGYTISPAKPGQPLTIYATGLGPITTGDNVAAPANNLFGASVQAIVGGVQIPASYAGRVPGFSGLDQINITLPTNIQTSCAVPLQISENGVRSASTFISIAPSATPTDCVYPGFTTSQLQNFDNGAVVYSGNFSLAQSSLSGLDTGGSTTIHTGGGAFVEYTGSQLPAIPVATAILIPTNGCTVTQIQTASGGPVAVGIGLPLDAGTITLNGPAGSGASNQVLADAGNIYTANITGLPAGTYTLNGAGGASVGAFNTSLALGTPIAVSGGLPSSVTRSNGITINWIGGNPSDIVVFSGTTANVSGETLVSGVSFTCITMAGAGTLTVPSSITNQLLAVTAAQETTGTAEGLLSFVSGPIPATFTAPLVGGGSLTNAIFAASVSTGTTATFQ